MTAASLGKKEQEMLAAKERAIQEMKRKIAEAEAKAKLKAKQASSGAQTPNLTSASPSETNGSVPTNPRSSSVVEKDDAPSTQLLSEAVAAKAPKRAEAPATPTTRPGDQHPPDVRASKPVETDKERRKREKAERMRRLQEEMARLAAEDDDDEEESQTQEVPPPARKAPVEEPVSVTQPMSSEPGKSLPTVSRDEHQDKVDVARLADPAADGLPKSSDEPASDLGDKPEPDEANEEGEIDESEDVSMTDAPQAAEALEQPDVAMEGTADGIPAAAPLISTALDDGNSEQPSQGGNSTGPFLCPVEGCVKNTRGFTKHKFLKTHIRRLDRATLLRGWILG
jgi:hypothetical protein